MTPEELHAALDAHKREKRRTWWQIAVELDACEEVLRGMRDGRLSVPLRRRVEAWMEEKEIAS